MIDEVAKTFTFDPVAHVYKWGDLVLPSVTQILKSAGLVDYSNIAPDVLEHARQRGVAVHAACHYLDDGDLNLATVTQEVKPYVSAWEQFKVDSGVKIVEMEKPRFSLLGFAGTPDRVVMLGGADGIIDIKTYASKDATGVQMAGYSRLVFHGDPRWMDFRKRWSVWLKDNGKYSLTEYKDRGDDAVFMSALTLFKFKEMQK